MPLTNQQIVKNYRERQKNLLGDAEYKRIQREKKREYRASKRAPIADVDGCDTLLNTIFEKKKKLLAKTGKIISLESFKKNTWGNLNKIYRKMNGDDWDCESLEWVKEADEIIKFIKEIYPSQNTFITNISSFASVTAVLGPSYKKAYTKYSDLSSNDRRAKDAVDNKNIMTESEQGKMIPYKELKNLYKNENLNLEERALVAIYTLLPPRRVEMSKYLKYMDNENDLPNGFNYLVMNDGKLKIVMKKYKTHKIYGDIELFINNTKLKKILLEYVADKGLENGDFVFGLSKSKINSNMSQRIIDVFTKASGKNISINTVRHIVASEFYKKNRSWAEIETFSKLMGNSPTMNQKYKRMDAPTKSQSELDDEIRAKFYQ